MYAKPQKIKCLACNTFFLNLNLIQMQSVTASFQSNNYDYCYHQIKEFADEIRKTNDKLLTDSINIYFNKESGEYVGTLTMNIRSIHE